jgi:hypothetical protein
MIPAALPCPPYVPFYGIVRVVGTSDRASVWSDAARIARRLHDRRQSFWNGRRASEAGAMPATVRNRKITTGNVFNPTVYGTSIRHLFRRQ